MVTTLLVLGVVALVIVDVGLIAGVFFGFGDIILIFFLAWLLAFILSPIVTALERLCRSCRGSSPRSSSMPSS